MTRKIWQSIAIAFLGLLISWGCSDRPPPKPESIAHFDRPSPQQPIASKRPLSDNIPPVDTDRLLAHVEALAYERYRETDRNLAREYIVQQLQDSGLSPQLHPFETGINLVAGCPGSDPEAGTILVGAHYDTVPGSPGADDNATGVAILLEIARLLSDRATPRSLQLVFFDREELALQGSFAFVASQTQNKAILGAIVLDMLGFACHTPGCQQYPDRLPTATLPETGDFLAVVGDTEHLPLLNTFPTSRTPDLPPVVTLPIPLRGLLAPDVLRSDHAPFWLQGLGAVMVTDTANFRNPHYHQPTDRPDTLDRAFFAGSAQIVLNATTTLLDSRESLSTPSLDPKP